MTDFDWRSFLDRAGVFYSEKDGGTNVYVACPFCGDDPSQHMGINVEEGSAYYGFWGCWRHEGHKGRAPAKLIAGLLSCSLKEATSIIDEGDHAPLRPLDDLVAALNTLGTKTPAVIEAMPTVIPSDFFSLEEPSPYRGRFLKYLRGRGFRREELLDVVTKYKLHGAVTGTFKDRLLFPFTRDGELIGWTGRAIVKAKRRYDTFFESKSAPPFVYNSDCLFQPGKVLFIVEGPLDVLKVDFYGEPHGARAIGLLGRNLNAGKINEIAAVADHFDQIVILLDDDAKSVALELRRQLTWIGKPITIEFVGEGVDDPGELNSIQTQQIVESVLV